MKLVRKGVFETNSSSCHSISIVGNSNILDKLYPNEEGNIIVKGGEFGWEIQNYNDPETKLSYCAQDIVQTSYPPKDTIEWKSEEKRDMLIKVIKDQTGCNEVIFDAHSLNDGYIDHQSSGTTDEAFFSEENLKTFIFNPSSSLHTDNDNH